MYKTTPFVSHKIWGYENWIVSSMGSGRSAICNNGKSLCEEDKVTGLDFPFLLKVIQANATLSVQVHPDNDYALKNEHSLGKSECWYVLDAIEDSTLICGLLHEYTKEELQSILASGTLDSHLNYVRVKRGDFLYIPSGTVHAIRGGLRLFEVQQASDITYRLYDWGRPRRIHVKQSLDVIKFHLLYHQSPFSGEFSCQFFNLKLDIIEKKTLLSPIPSKSKYNILVVIEGSLTIASDMGQNFNATSEDAFIILDKENVTLLPKTSCKIIRVY